MVISIYLQDIYRVLVFRFFYSHYLRFIFFFRNLLKCKGSVFFWIIKFKLTFLFFCGILRCSASRTSLWAAQASHTPLRQLADFAPTTHAKKSIPCPWCFLCIYMYICECPENTRVGANCNSPSHMGEIENMGKFEMGAICNKGELQYGRICNVGEL